MRTYLYRIHLEPEPEGGYTVTVPALPGCVTWGKDYKQALANAHECIGGFIEALIKAGRPVPVEDEPQLLTDIVIQVQSDSEEDPIFKLGTNPVDCGTPDVSENFDEYLYRNNQ